MPQLSVMAVEGDATTEVISEKGALNWNTKDWVVPVVKPVPAVFVEVFTLEITGMASD